MHGSKPQEQQPIASLAGEAAGDLASILKAAQALSSETTLPQLMYSLAALSSKNADLMTGLQQAQDHVQASEQRFRLLFENAPVGIFEIDISNGAPRILAANRRAEAAYGYSAGEFAVMDPAELIPDESRHEIQRLIDSIRSGKTGFLESTNRRKDGTHFPVRITATPARHEQDLHMIVTVEDVTAQRQRRSEAEAIDAERRRIAHEIHDGVAQDLAALRLKLSLWRDWITADPERMQDELDQTQGTLDTAIDEIRRSIYALRPLALDEVGLLAALRRYIADFNDQHGVYVDLQMDILDERLPASLELPLFRAVQEALNNIAHHAKASLARVRLEIENSDIVTLTISDNGRGIDMVSLSRAGRNGRLGLVQMRERIEQAGGQLTVASQPDKGTEIRINLPLG